MGENDDESEDEWEDGAQDLIANENEIGTSARDLENRRRLDEFMNKVGRPTCHSWDVQSSQQTCASHAR